MALFGNLFDGRHRTWDGDFLNSGHRQLLVYSANDGSWTLGETKTAEVIQWTALGRHSFPDLMNGGPVDRIYLGDFLGTRRIQPLVFQSVGSSGEWWWGNLVGPNLLAKPPRLHAGLTWVPVSSLPNFGWYGFPGNINDLLGNGRQQILYLGPSQNFVVLGAMDDAGSLQFLEVSSKVFGPVSSQSFLGDFLGLGHAQLLWRLFPTRDTASWWLGNVVSGEMQWSQISEAVVGDSIWIADFLGAGAAQVLSYSADDGNWFLGNVQASSLQWIFIDKSGGFGNLLDPSHRIWIGDFTGSGRTQILFYYSGDGNWWLGDVTLTGISWSLASESAGFGNLLDSTHQIWLADILGVGYLQVLFYYRGDGNWWLGQLIDRTLVWTLVSESAGFGDLLDGAHHFWFGDFDGTGKQQVLFYFQGDGNWWLGGIPPSSPDLKLSWAAKGNTGV